MVHVNYDDAVAYAKWLTEKDRASGKLPAGYSDASIVTCDVEDSWKNPWGLYGVGGNVWECTSKAPGGAVDAWRGAAWGGNPQNFLRCSFRDACYASGRTYATGFRLLRNRQPVPKGETASG